MSFQQGLSGLNGSAKSLDVIGHNIANASTVGFKSSQTQFADVYATSLYGVGGLQVGIGVKVADVAQSFTQGNVSTTGNTLDLAVTGEGFFQVSKDGVTSYTRNGQFHLDSLGYVVDNSLARVQGFAATNGVLATAPGSDLQVTYTTGQPQVTANVEMAVNLNADATPTTYNSPVAPALPATTDYNHTTSVTVYDTLGSEHTLTFYFSKGAAAVDPVDWDVHAYLDGLEATIDGAANMAMTFPVATGQYAVPAIPPVVSGNVLVGGVSTALSINADLTGSTMFSGKFGVNTLAQDGYAKGDLAKLAVTKDGIIQAQYTNGQALTIGQLSLTSFNNPNGLLSIGENHWISTPEAGTANTQQPNSGILGLIQSGAVEESNVDLTAELVNMIVAQRMYQANAQTIKTQDQILQTLVNLR
jgi:flagellar hook protein FlgE